METLFSPDDKPEAVSQLVPEATWYRSLYKTQESWSRARRVVTKVCYNTVRLSSGAGKLVIVP
jgi:streptomycin 6-kinase